ncbi:MAG: hypothetical protein QNJ15_13950 [Erythrobacter sp.]|nr:hypothetical protein [Erythrobacter sp.]
MVVGIRLICLPLLALVACSPAGQAQGGEEAVTREVENTGLQSANIDGTEYELVALGRICAVRFGEDQLVLDLPPPCRFIARGATDAATVENYGEAGSVALIAGPLAAEGDYALSEDRAIADGCSHLAQPLLVKGGIPSIGAIQVSALGFCRNSAPDEKFYYGLAHPPE